MSGKFPSVDDDIGNEGVILPRRRTSENIKISSTVQGLQQDLNGDVNSEPVRLRNGGMADGSQEIVENDRYKNVDI